MCDNDTHDNDTHDNDTNDDKENNTTTHTTNTSIRIVILSLFFIIVIRIMHISSSISSIIIVLI